jgi:uncharacterized repeat protein (TIGR02543 family)
MTIGGCVPVPSRVTLLALALLLCSVAVSDAGVSPFWLELAGSASGDGVSQAVSPAEVFDAAMAVGPDGRPVVAYTEYPNAVVAFGAITVKRWTGSAWETLGSGSDIGQGFMPQIRIASDGATHVAWLQEDGNGDSEIHLRVRTASTWDELGGSDSPGGITGTNAGITTSFSLALRANGNPLVAFLGVPQTGIVDPSPTPALLEDSRQVYVRHWTGSAWEFLGSDFTGGGASNTLSFLNANDQAVFHDADTPALTVNSSGDPVVAFTYLTTIDGDLLSNSDIFVTRWNGTAWIAVGPAVPTGDTPSGNGAAAGVSNSPTGSFNPSLAAGPGGLLGLAWEEDAGSGAVYVWVREWDGGTWVERAQSASGSGISQAETINGQPQIAVDSTGRVVVAWQALTDLAAPSQIFVLRSNGSNPWEELGLDSAHNAGISGAALDVNFPSLALTAAGVPAVAWVDVRASGSGQVFLRQLYTGATFPLTVSVFGDGTVSSDPVGVQCAGGTCVADFPTDTVVTLVPTAGPFRDFSAWAGDCTGSGACMVAMTGPVSINASFVGAVRISLAVGTPAGVLKQGDVGSITHPGGSCGFQGAGECAADVAPGTLVVLLASPEPGNKFLNWSGGPCNGRTNATCQFTAAANASTTALFRGATSVQVLKAGSGSGTVTAVGFNCGSDCADDVFTGTSRTLTAAPAIGSRFLGWSGDFCHAQASGACLYTANSVSNQSVTATFQLTRHRLAVSATGTGTGFTVSAPAGIDCGGGHSPCVTDYDYGTLVRLTPFPATDNMLSSWTGCTSLNGSVCNVLMTANRTVTVRFGPARTLSVAASGNGSGRITTLTAPGLTCVSNCSVSQQFALGAAVTLTPQPTVGTTFRWTGGDICSGSGTCLASMSANHSAVGQFTLNRHSLLVANRLNGSVVNVQPLPGGAGIDCGNGDAVCSGVFDWGTPIALQATPVAGFTFVNWTGTACAGSTNSTCAFALKANVTVTPNYRARTVVTVVKAGNGAGTVSGPGISCGGTCSAAELDAKPVKLTATPAVGSRFLGFTDACVSSTSTCTFVPAGDSQTVTATFERIPFRLTVTDRDNGDVANLNTLPDDIACGAGGNDCQAILDFGTEVVLRATPIAGSRFVNWTGGVCNGLTNATCTFKIPAGNVSLAPNFRNVTTLSLNKSGMGTIASFPAGISCGPTCNGASFDFARGTLVRLTATPTIGWSFDGFSGACSGPTCTVNASTVSALVGASFSIQHRRLNVTVVGNGSLSGPGITCDQTTTPCTQDFDYGTTVPLTPVAADGYRFTGWSQDCVGANPTTCRPLMTANHSVTAKFQPIFTLAVSRTGNSNSGTITSSPAGINCGIATSDCSEAYLGGTLVTLTRSAPPIGTLFRWMGDCAFRGTNATCALPLNANASVTGDYRLQQLGLTVNRVGPLFGTVTGTGINCGSDCAELVDYGTDVVLLATPTVTPASEFVSWAGCTSAASNASCSFRMTANRTVTVTFRPLVSAVTLDALSGGPLGILGVRQVSATATFTDGSQQDVTAQSTWSSNASAIATVNASGLVTGRAMGNTSVTARFRNVTSGPFPIEVDTLQAIAVSCSPYGEPAGDANRLRCLPSTASFEVHCQAIGTFANHAPTTFDITDQATWVSSNGFVARSTGLVAFAGPEVRQSFRIVGPPTTANTAVLYARQGSRTSPTTGVLGTNPWVVQGAPHTVTALRVEPPTGIVQVDDDEGLQLQAIATLTSTVAACSSAPSERDFSLLVEWESDNEALAEVSFFGEVTGVAPGGATITATYGSFTDTAAVTVQP